MTLPPAPHPLVTFRIGVQDTPGVMSAVAAVFSGRGVSMESILTFRGWQESDEPQVLVTVRANERRRHMLHRVLERLQVVTSVKLLGADDSSLFLVALIRVPGGAEMGDGVRALPMEDSAHGEQRFLLAGACAAVEKELRRLDGAGLLLGASLSRMSA